MNPRNDLEPSKTRSVDESVEEPPVLYLAEDDDDLRGALITLFSHDGFEVRAAPDGTVLFDWLFRERGPGTSVPDVIVMDHRMPGYSSLDILECLSEVDCKVPVIVITAFCAEVRRLALAYGAYEVFCKPFDLEDLRSATRCCIDRGGRAIGPERYERKRGSSILTRRSLGVPINGTNEPDDA